MRYQRQRTMLQVHRRAGMSIAGMVADARQIVSLSPGAATFLDVHLNHHVPIAAGQAGHDRKQRHLTATGPDAKNLPWDAMAACCLFLNHHYQ